jgi:5-methylcytosine-specific restriction endonuclease McrA
MQFLSPELGSVPDCVSVPRFGAVTVPPAPPVPKDGPTGMGGPGGMGRGGRGGGPSAAAPLQFTASQEYVDLLEEAFELLGFGKKAASLPEVQLRALRELVERLRKQKRGPSEHPTRKILAPETPERVAPSSAPERESQAGASIAVHAPQLPKSDGGRHVPIAVSRAVWTRDRSQCAYVDERGRRCAEKRGLELHHREPYARGGPSTEHNLELRCRAHNTLAAEDDFGREHMDWMRGSADANAP